MKSLWTVLAGLFTLLDALALPSPTVKVVTADIRFVDGVGSIQGTLEDVIALRPQEDPSPEGRGVDSPRKESGTGQGAGQTQGPGDVVDDATVVSRQTTSSSSSVSPVRVPETVTEAPADRRGAQPSSPSPSKTIPQDRPRTSQFPALAEESMTPVELVASLTPEEITAWAVDPEKYNLFPAIMVMSPIVAGSMIILASHLATWFISKRQERHTVFAA